MCLDRWGERLENQIDAVKSTLSKKLDCLAKKVNVIETNYREIRSIVDKTATTSQIIEQRQQVPQPMTNTDDYNPDTFQEGIPELFQIPMEILRNIQRDAKSPGNFAFKLVVKLFPELFGPEKLRQQYNVNGVNGTKALDSARMTILKRYTFYFHPECNRPSAWQSIVNAINEGLRCQPSAAEKKKSMNQQVSSNDDLCYTQTADTCTTHHNTNPDTHMFQHNENTNQCLTNPTNADYHGGLALQSFCVRGRILPRLCLNC